jgi:protein-tyrosine phosphatase
MAQFLLDYHLEQSGLTGSIETASAGTRVSQPGARPDPRVYRVAASRCIKMGRTRANLVTVSDLMKSDFIFAMEHSHVKDLHRICPTEHQPKISLLLSHVLNSEVEEVPDPYYRSYKVFENVFLLLDRAMPMLMEHIRSSLSEL